MRRDVMGDLRRILRAHPDGLTIKQLCGIAGMSDSRYILRALKSMPDVYIDRWDGPHRGQFSAVWCVVEVPADCPHPTKG